jgi:cytochrome bd-type quinol oxidase subunit 2
MGLFFLNLLAALIHFLVLSLYSLVIFPSISSTTCLLTLLQYKSYPMPLFLYLVAKCIRLNLLILTTFFEYFDFLFRKE